MPSGVFTNSTSPNSSRRRFSALLTDGWVRCSASAARVVLRDRYSTSNTRSRLRSTLRRSFSGVIGRDIWRRVIDGVNDGIGNGNFTAGRGPPRLLTFRHSPKRWATVEAKDTSRAIPGQPDGPQPEEEGEFP